MTGLEWLAAWGVAQTTVFVFRPILEDLAKDCARILPRVTSPRVSRVSSRPSTATRLLSPPAGRSRSCSSSCRTNWKTPTSIVASSPTGSTTSAALLSRKVSAKRLARSSSTRVINSTRRHLPRLATGRRGAQSARELLLAARRQASHEEDR